MRPVLVWLLGAALVAAQRPSADWYRQARFYESTESKIITLDRQSKQLVNLVQITPEYELQLGEQAFAPVNNTAPPLDDPEYLGAIERIVQRLTGATPGPNLPLKMSLHRSPAINAAAVPGHIAVFSGLMAGVQTEGQLAAVLAHELGHVYGHHMARQLVKTASVQMAVNAALSLVDQKNGLATTLTQLAGGFGVNLFRLAYSRFEEKEADLYGAHILYNAGYDPTAMSEFMLALATANTRQPVKFLSTHPPAQDRASYLTDYLEKFPMNREFQTDSTAFQTLRARLGYRPETAQPVAPPPAGGNTSSIGATIPPPPPPPGEQTSGRIFWTGNLRANELLTIGRRYADKGAVQGELPGNPVSLTILTPDVTLFEPPNAATGWSRFSIISRKRAQSSVTIEWRVRQ
jgi:beta-barrel assembly-enhancing protease